MAIYLRHADERDVDLLFLWANDEIVRQNSFHSEKIDYEEHLHWFEKMMADPNQAQYILMNEEKPIGQIRISINGEDAEISYSIDKKERGFGYGKLILTLIKPCVKKEYPFVKKLIGRVKPTNTASAFCFLESDFSERFQQFEYDVHDNISSEINGVEKSGGG